MEQKTEHYNLLIEDWIPVLWNDGTYSRVGILEAFTKAGEIRQVAEPNPLDDLSILRLVLAVLQWCKPSVTNDERTMLETADGWFTELEEHQDCFNLLGKGKRFYQDIGAQRKRPATDLVHEIPTGNNFWHFRHATDKMDGLCPSFCHSSKARHCSNSTRLFLVGSTIYTIPETILPRARPRLPGSPRTWSV